MSIRFSKPRLLLLACLLLFSCNLPATGLVPTVTASPVPVTETLPPSSTPSPAITNTPSITPTATLAIKGYFTMAVIVDTTSEPVTQEQAQNQIDDANKIFPKLTSFEFKMIAFSEDAGGGSMTSIANRYIQSHSDSLPNGIIIYSFGDGGQAKTYGGYSYTLPGPTGYHNTFVSPAVGGNRIYIAIVHFNHRYAVCGYGNSSTVQSSTSIGGECRNQPGTACVMHNGYSMCANAVDNLYASTPTYFGATTIIHEFMHPFAPGGNMDHYGTPQCNQHMGYPNGFFDLQKSEYYNGLCPFVYDNFVNSYQP